METKNDASFIMAERLKQLRKGRGLSHDKLSKALLDQYGITISTDSLMNYEVTDPYHSKAGKNQGMKVEYLRYLANFYGVSTDYLLGLTTIKSTNEDVQAVCAVTGLRDDNIYDLMGLTNPKDAVYLREMVNEFLSFAVDDCAICTYKAFRKYIDLDNQRWDETQQLTEGEYQDKLEKLRQLSAEAEKHGYQIMSYNESAEKEWQKLCDEYGKFLLKQYRSFDTQSDTENSKEACDGTY